MDIGEIKKTMKSADAWDIWVDLARETEKDGQVKLDEDGNPKFKYKLNESSGFGQFAKAVSMTVTKELLLLTQEEYENPAAHEELISRWFLVPTEQDDRALCTQLREPAALTAPPKTAITEYIPF